MISKLERYKYLLLACVLCAGAVVSYLFGSYAYNANKLFGFPLDDPWIHLQFAKNLHDYGSFSYFKNEMVTAGSTSPLYTLLLAVGFFFTSNEMMLSYALGVAFLLAAAFFIFKLTSIHRAEPYGSHAAQKAHPSPSHAAPVSPLPLALGISLLLLLEARMQWAAHSGMETTLFICVLLGVLYFYQSKQSIPFGVASGLLLWTRPEAIIFFVAIVFDMMYHSYWVAHPKAKKKSETLASPSLSWLKTSVFVAAFFALAYAGFNLYLSGSIFPNTFAAKVKFYANGAGKAAFPIESFRFFTGGHMMLIALLAAVGIIDVVVRFVKRQTQTQLVALLFSCGMFIAYYMELPYLYQEGRYMMPVLPFILMLGIAGLQLILSPEKKLFGLLRKREQVVIAQLLVIAAVVVQFSIASWEKRTDYAEMCKYINDRQVRTGKWLHDNTPENATIGTHDIGAIAFYSQRKIADMVGLVSPEMIQNIGNLDKLKQFLVTKHTTHIAVLRNWFEIVNQSALFKTDESVPEIMEVFPFDPERTHVTSREAAYALGAATQALYRGQFDVAGQMLQRALQLDPQSSKVHHLVGSLFVATTRLDEANREFALALKLNPDLLESQIGLAQVAARQNRPDDGIAQLETIAQRNPKYPTVYRALSDMYVTFKPDSAKAKMYLQRYNQLMKEQQ